MKTSRNYLIAPTLALFGALLFSGCYTQFVLSDGDADESTSAGPVYVEPPVTVIEYIPVPYWIPELPAPLLPIAGSGSGAPGDDSHSTEKRLRQTMGSARDHNTFTGAFTRRRDHDTRTGTIRPCTGHGRAGTSSFCTGRSGTGTGIRVPSCKRRRFPEVARGQRNENPLPLRGGCRGFLCFAHRCERRGRLHAFDFHRFPVDKAHAQPADEYDTQKPERAVRAGDDRV